MTATVPPRVCILFTALIPGLVQAAHETLPDLTITGADSGFEHYQIKTDRINAPATDSAQLLKRLPGANVNSNGTQTGIAQYRGMYGERISQSIDGMRISSVGPNRMDTPLSYVPRAQLDSLTVQRGIASVSSGNESIGGSIDARSRSSQFTDSDIASFSGRLGADYHSVDRGYDFSALLSAANRDHRAHVAISRQDGDDYRFDGGKVSPSEYDHNNYRLGYGFRSGAHELGFDYMRNDTNDSGTPALPNDIIVVDSDNASANYTLKLEEMTVEARLYGSDIEHRMNNYQLRETPNPLFQRFILATADSAGYRVDASMPLAGGELRFGTDGHLANHDADIFNPNNTAFTVNNFNQIERDVFGFFGEWQGAIAERWSLETGLRYTRVSMDAGQVAAAGLPGPLQVNASALASAFNAADRSVDDHNVDIVAELGYELDQNTRLEAAIGRKTRSPSYQERYLWLPLQATSGLADGNNYIGNIDLDPEVAWQLELGLDWRNSRAWFAPRAFYHHIDDYIQSDTPSNATAQTFHTIITTVMGSNASLLQFSNVDARIYGLDADWGYRFNPQWQLHGGIALLKGERRDTGDNLYRIAPVNARLALTHERDNWSATVETEAYLDKDDVSAVNREPETAGYALLNVYGHYRPVNTGFTLKAGIDNLLDKDYAPHLGGINRVRNVDVAVGERLPGPGLNAFVSLSYEW